LEIFLDAAWNSFSVGFRSTTTVVVLIFLSLFGTRIVAMRSGS
jgi:hypothetical protein